LIIIASSGAVFTKALVWCNLGDRRQQLAGAAGGALARDWGSPAAVDECGCRSARSIEITDLPEHILDIQEWPARQITGQYDR
jgi:hypothetical protein